MKLPPWVPPLIALEARALLNGEYPHIQLPKNAPAVIALASDPRMKAVWHKLKKQTVRFPRAQLIEVLDRAWDITNLNDLSDSDLALRQIFMHAVLFAFWRVRVESVSELKEAAESFRRQAKRLRDTAAELLRLQRFINLARGDFANSIEVIAVECERRAATIETRVITDAKREGLLAQRDHGFREEHAFCQLLTQEVVRLYGKKLSPTVATIASVALNREVDLRRVSKWVTPTRNKSAQ
jgi:hypothetical protein